MFFLFFFILFTLSFLSFSSFLPFFLSFYFSSLSSFIHSPSSLIHSFTNVLLLNSSTTSTLPLPLHQHASHHPSACQLDPLRSSTVRRPSFLCSPESYPSRVGHGPPPALPAMSPSSSAPTSSIVGPLCAATPPAGRSAPPRHRRFSDPRLTAGSPPRRAIVSLCSTTTAWVLQGQGWETPRRSGGSCSFVASSEPHRSREQVFWALPW